MSSRGGPASTYSVASASMPPGFRTRVISRIVCDAPVDPAEVLDRRQRIRDIEGVVREVQLPAVHLHERQPVAAIGKRRVGVGPGAAPTDRLRVRAAPASRPRTGRSPRPGGRGSPASRGRCSCPAPTLTTAASAVSTPSRRQPYRNWVELVRLAVHRNACRPTGRGCAAASAIPRCPTWPGWRARTVECRTARRPSASRTRPTARGHARHWSVALHRQARRRSARAPPSSVGGPSRLFVGARRRAHRCPAPEARVRAPAGRRASRVHLSRPREAAGIPATTAGRASSVTWSLFRCRCCSSASSRATVGG